MAKKIIMLVGPGESAKCMYNGIKDDFEIVRVVRAVGAPGGRKKFIKRRIKRLGYWTVLGQILFKVICVPLLKRESRKRVISLINDLGLSYEEFPESILLDVPHVNSAECEEALKNMSPDIVIVNGTEIIAKRILNCIDGRFVNTHVGITPKYRGVHGGYWALAKNDRENCGVTVHLVDPGIDTGDILYQATVDPTKEDNYITYPYLQIEKGIQCMKKALTDLINDGVVTKSGGEESHLYYHPTLWGYVGTRIFKGVK